MRKCIYQRLLAGATESSKLGLQFGYQVLNLKQNKVSPANLYLLRGDLEQVGDHRFARVLESRRNTVVLGALPLYLSNLQVFRVDSGNVRKRNFAELVVNFGTKIFEQSGFHNVFSLNVQNIAYGA